jgi:hypothetical protein
MTRKLILATALVAASLGACSRSQPDTAAEESGNMLPADEPAPDVNTSAELPAPAPAPVETGTTTDTNAAAAATTTTTEAAPPPDQQMMDDASATGMTARSSRGDNRSDEATPEQPEVK